MSFIQCKISLCNDSIALPNCGASSNRRAAWSEGSCIPETEYEDYNQAVPN